MSEGLQKTAGSKMRSVLHLMTGNRFYAILTGLLITCIINSSSATTVMVVSFVNAGLMGLTQAIGVILGANIGTTITGWIVAILGFKVHLTTLSLVLAGVALPLMFMHDSRKNEIGEMTLGFGILFIGLEFLKNSMPDISHSLTILRFLETLNSGSIGTVLVCVLIGMLITILVQSSSAAMAVTLTMAYQGWIGLYAATALVLGQNIGTTITAFLASIGTSTNAKRAAWAHILFNVIGSFIAIIFYKQLLSLVNRIMPQDIFSLSGEELNTALPTFLAMFHTTFNLINTILFTPFINQYARFIEKIVPSSAEYEKETYHFKLLGNTFVDTPGIYLLAIRDEIKKMAVLASDMYSSYLTIFRNPDKNLSERFKKLKHQEDYADQMQEQLTAICVRLSANSPAKSSAETLGCFIRVIDELESITDSCYNLLFLSQRRYENKWEMDENAEKILEKFENMVQRFLNFIRDNIDSDLKKEDLERAIKFEEEINNTRYEISETVYNRLTTKSKDVRVEMLILDITRNLEHIGDYCTNIAEAYAQAVKHTPDLTRNAE